MTGIFGLLHQDGRPVARAHLERMASALSLWPLSQAELWAAGPAGLGRVTSGGTPAPPLRGAGSGSPGQRAVVVASSRLSNRRELVSRLAAQPEDPRELTDERLILLAYREWELDCPRHLDGEFAFALWDPENRRLVLGRDRLGHRPLFLFHRDGLFVFASQIRALRFLDLVPRELNERTLAESLSLVEPDRSQTWFLGIRRMAAAQVLTVPGDGGAPRASSYWAPASRPDMGTLSDEVSAESLREVIVRSVRRCAGGDRPVGALLSGGLDSSAICCIAARQLLEGGEPLLAVSSVLPPDHRGVESDEREYIEVVAGQEANLVTHAVLAEGMGPFGGLEAKFDRHSATVNTFHYMDEALADTCSGLGLRTVLSGFHGDFLASYDGKDSVARLLASGRYQTGLACAARLRRAGLDTSWTLFRSGVLPGLFPGSLERLRRMVRARRTSGRATPASPAFLERFRGVVRGPGSPYPDLLRNLATHGSPAVEYWNVEFASRGMSVRFPYWNEDLLELAMAVPPEQFVLDGCKRSLFRRAMDGILPERIRVRTTKHPYTPDFHRRVLDRRLDLERYLDQVESDPAFRGIVAPYIDTGTIRRHLATIRPARGRLDWDRDTQAVVVNGIMLIRFLIWMRSL